MKISYKQFKKLEVLFELVKEGDLNPMTTSTKMVKICYGLTDDEIRKLSSNKLESYILEITKQLSSEPELTFRFVYEGVTYGLVPNFSKITTGELIDLDTLLNDEDILGIMSILYRPILEGQGTTYTVEPYEGVINRFNDLDWSIVKGCLDFFWTSFHHLKKTTLSSITKK